VRAYSLYVIDNAYQLEMMRSLRDVHVDHHSVGWYASTVGLSLDFSLLNNLYAYQQELDSSIVLLYGDILCLTSKPNSWLTFENFRP